MRRQILVAITAIITLLAVTHTASAADFHATSTAEITQRINDAIAAPGSDTVHVAAGSYAINGATFPQFAADASNPIRIVGAGVGQTIFTMTTNASDTTAITQSLTTQASSLEGFTLLVTFDAHWSRAVELDRGTLKDFVIEVTPGSGVNNLIALLAHDGTSVLDGRIKSVGGAVGISAIGNNEIRRVAIEGPGGIGISTRGPSQQFSHLSIRDQGSAIQIGDGTVELTDSVIDMGSITSARGIEQRDQDIGVASISNIDVRRATIVGTGASQSAIYVQTHEGMDSVTGAYRDIVAYNPSGAGFSALYCAGVTSGQIDLYRIAHTGVRGAYDGCSYGFDPAMISVLGSSPFRNFAAGDLRPPHDSPLVDGGLTVAGAGPSDLAGSARVVDGDGDGTAKVDIGAFEYQRAAPSVSLSADKLELAPLEATIVTADASDADDEQLTYAWTLDGVPSPLANSSHPVAFLTPGAHSVAVTVTDEAGVATTAALALNVASPAGVPTSPVCPAIFSDRAPVKVKAKRPFKRGKKGFSVVKAKKGKKLKQPYFALQAQFPSGESSSRLQFTLESVGKKGKRTKLKGTQVIKVRRGVTSFNFGGKWNKKRLKAGTYRVSVLPLVKGGDCRSAETTSLQLRLK